MKITILSICGPSAIGKATLIRYLKNRQKVRTIFGLDEKISIIVTERNKKEGSESIKHLSPTTDCYILHKWQTFDKDELKEINELKEKFPNATRRIIILWLSWDNWWYGFRSKYNDNEAPMKTHIDWWYKTIIPKLQKIGLPLEHYKMSYPKEGGAAEYRKLEKIPEQPTC